LRNLPTFPPIPSSASEKEKARGRKRRKNRGSKESRLPVNSEVGMTLREIIRMNKTPRPVFIFCLSYDQVNSRNDKNIDLKE
jgi:hypothetical protein